METSVLPYTAETDGKSRLSGKPERINNCDQLTNVLNEIDEMMIITSKCNPEKLVIALKCQRVIITVEYDAYSFSHLQESEYIYECYIAGHEVCV